LLLTRQDNILHKSWELPSTAKAIQKACRDLLDYAGSYGFQEDAVFGIHLALEEALVNAFKHGNKSNPEKIVFVECLITPEKFDVSITDQGEGFKPEKLPDPRVNGNLYKCSGRGVLLINAYMDEVEYNECGNSVHMIKFRQPQQTPTDEN
jgi:serine/threonine-protein kinase RsbW